MRGWWELKVTGDMELRDLDDSGREQIAKWITDGCTSGEIIQHEDTCPACDRKLTHFMHNCPESSTMPEVYGCPEHDDTCTLCS